MNEDYMELVERAYSNLDRGDVESGIALLKQASELAGEADESLQQSAILNNLGLAQNR